MLTQAFYEYLKNAYKAVFTYSYQTKIRQKKLIGKVCCDCSGLISWYTNHVLGSSQLYSQAYTRLPIAKVKEFAVGTVLWKQGHVGVYIGMENGVPMCVEEKGIDYGCVKTKVSATKWVYGLTFNWIDYIYKENLAGEATWKGKNPYKQPTRTIKKGCKGEDVRWVQWELREAGFDREFVYNGKKYKAVAIDGDAGTITDAAICAYQQSVKIKVDGKCGKNTRAKMIAD